MPNKEVIFLVEDEELLHQVFNWEFEDSNDVKLVISADEVDAWDKFKSFKKDISVMVVDGNLGKGGDTLNLMQAVKESRGDKTFSGTVIISSAVEGPHNALLKTGGWDISCPKGGSINILDVAKRALDAKDNPLNPLKKIKVLVLERDMKVLGVLEESINSDLIELVVLDSHDKMEAELGKSVFDLSFVDIAIAEENEYLDAAVIKGMFGGEKLFITIGPEEGTRRRFSATDYQYCKKNEIIGVIAAKGLAAQNI